MHTTENPVHLSTAALWPLAGILPTRWSEKVALRIGAEGLEVLPGRSAVKEYFEQSFLTLDRMPVRSFHESWRRDRRQEETLGLPVSLTNRIASAFFPSEKVTRVALNGLQKLYGAPVVFHWLEDTGNYEQPMLEPHPYLPETPEQVITWAETDPQRGLVIDVSQRKLGDWCQRLGITDREAVLGVVARMLPHARFIQFQVGNKEEFQAVQDRDGDSRLAQLTRAIKQQRQDIPFVIEVNFPRMAAVFKTGTFQFYSQVVDFIQSV